MTAAHTIMLNMDDVHPAVRLREQRRYEISRDVMAGFAGLAERDLDQIGGYDKCAALAVEWADALLAKLEK